MMLTLLSMMLAVGDSTCLVSREVEVETGAGQHIAAVIESPKGNRSDSPLLVFISGAGPDDRFYWIPVSDMLHPGFQSLTRPLFAAGYPVVRFDERGTGRSSGSYHETATTRTLADDVQALVRFLRSDQETGTRPIILAGHSEGAAIAALVASENRDVAGVILLGAPAVTGQEVIAHQHRYRLADASQWPPGYTIRQRDSALVAEHTHRQQTEAWYRFFLTYDPMPAYRTLRQPVLVLHGQRDWKVPHQQALTIIETLRRSGAADVTLKLMPDADHEFRESPSVLPFSTVVGETLTSWIGERFAARGQGGCRIP